MFSCWYVSASDRPDFPTLVLQIRSLLARHSPDPISRFIRPDSEHYFIPILPGRLSPEFQGTMRR